MVEDLRNRFIREELEHILVRGIPALGHNPVSSAMSDTLLYLYPLTREDDDAQQVRKGFNAVRQDTLAQLTDALMPPDPQSWGAYQQIIKALVPALDTMSMNEYDARMAREVRGHIEQFKVVRARLEDDLPEFDQLPPGASSCGPLVKAFWELPVMQKHIETGLHTATQRLEGILHDYHASYTYLVRSAKGIVAFYQNALKHFADKSQGQGEQDVNAMELTLDHIETLVLPFDETWVYPQKRAYLQKLEAHIATGYGVEALNRWASDVSFGMLQKREQMSIPDAYDAADKLLKFSLALPEAELEAIRSSLRDAMGFGMNYPQAKEYLNALYFRPEDKALDAPQREARRQTIRNVAGVYRLPVPITMEIADGEQEKRYAGVPEDGIASWIGKTIFAAQRGCDYATAQTFVESLAAREAEGKIISTEDEEKGWRNIYAQGLGFTKQSSERAAKLADDHYAIAGEQGLPVANDWANAAAFALQREMAYDDAKRFGETALGYVSKYAQKQHWLSWQRVAFDYLQKGMGLDAAAEKAYEDTKHLANGNGKLVNHLLPYVGADITSLAMLHAVMEEETHAP